MEQKQKFPTEMVELPSKGLLYPKDSPLASGKIEMKYMTAREEDILTNQNYIQQGVVIDKLLQSLIVTPITYGDLLLGDKNAILVASRILGYGKDYEFEYKGRKEVIDLSELKPKEVDYKALKLGKNEFAYTMLSSGTNITFKLLTHTDEQLIDQEVKGLKKLSKDASPELSTRLKRIITSVEGDSTIKTIRDFVDNFLLARDSRAFREHIRQVQPDVDLRFFPEDGPDGGVDIPIGVSFLWPDAGV
ncbi:baseplate hub subunit [Flavobacterium phage vB_FspM_immuto_3-5A]|uniref:Baseplate hub subunit n=1 Tax=Flavobacterium phage vB_FspM_immuto_2-6A TaxID=2801477 RepID=A0A7T8ERR2_9CAUD|nr:baseplate hub subunit [Flavobacterium phage vB_FspM_immuto_2-6A]QQO91911.1 baseplate hub subunit [Flavobacterium phage vB_FspM_immuto_2-6A]QQO92149.1 baseplate hub subunit [Flavobacterium phage vB_FspM_immuto_3-5A]QQO92387.1 baseplate hub subunit [Flavobacterium phage vB_FspM_immuto_13-6C]